MKVKNRDINFKQIIYLTIYYGLLYYLPGSGFPVLGKLFKKIRYQCCRQIFKQCGKNVNIERCAFFASGSELCIGDYSGLGYHCNVPGNIQIGKYVMMGPNCHILGSNHSFNDCNTPMMFQGSQERKQTIIEDDVWIGQYVTMTPGRTVKKGTIIGVGCVLTKDFPEYSVVGGNPAVLIKNRK